MRAALTLAIVLTVASLHAQPATVQMTVSRQGGPAALDTVLARLSEYLIAYEPELSALTAEESFIQGSHRERLRTPDRRELVSDVAFMRLPGDGPWLGYREVRSVNGRAVTRQGPSLIETLARPGRDNERLAMEIAWASAHYNLGAPRTINMPGLPLELMHPRNRSHFTFRLGRARRVGRFSTIAVTFVEQGSPSLVRSPDNRRDMTSSGTLWIEPETGRLIKAEVRIRDRVPAPRGAATSEGTLIVEFGEHPDLMLLVPTAMTEHFLISGGTGEGRAKYSNYRRFSTGARIVPGG